MAHGKVAVDRLAPTHTLAGDFCRIFAEDMSSLYRLAYLLTGDAQKAESCFGAALKECLHSVGVFQEWARPWARRTVIQTAIRLENPVRGRTEASSRQSGTPGGLNDLLRAVAELPTFPRFVYVMTVLERLSDQDCKLLLGSTRQEVVAARLEAMRSVAAKDMARSLIRPSETNEVEECRLGVSPFVIPVEADSVTRVEKRIA